MHTDGYTRWLPVVDIRITMLAGNYMTLTGYGLAAWRIQNILEQVQNKRAPAKQGSFVLRIDNVRDFLPGLVSCTYYCFLKFVSVT
jgi:hypothetical protein